MAQFSIVIPVYNVERYLSECLDSVLAQSCADWEAVCVDDGSTDGSGAILDRYASRDSRIVVLRQPNKGLSAARNAGLDKATGDYVLFLDSDDWLETTALQCLSSNLSPFTSHLSPLDMLCFGGWQGGKVEMPTAEGPMGGWDYYNRHALEHRTFPFVCVVLRCYRRAFLEANRLRFREGILHEDNEFTPRACLRAKSVSMIPAMLYHYRIREGSIMTTRSLRSRQDLIRIANGLAELFISESGIDKTVVYRSLTHHYQAAFAGATRDESRQLRPLVDWSLYRRVSRTKPRHRVNYIILRIFTHIFFQTRTKP